MIGMAAPSELNLALTPTDAHAGISEDDMMDLSYPTLRKSLESIESPISMMLMEDPTASAESDDLLDGSRRLSAINRLCTSLAPLSPFGRRQSQKTSGTPVSSELDCPQAPVGSLAPLSPFVGRRQSQKSSGTPVSSELDCLPASMGLGSGSTLPSPNKVSPTNFSPSSSTSPQPMPTLPNLEFKISSSELDPSQFQLDIPDRESVLLCARLCQFLRLNKNANPFDFDQNLQTCTGDIEILKERFLTHSVGDTSIHVLIVSSEKLRQVFVCCSVDGDEQLAKKSLRHASAKELPGKGNVQALAAVVETSICSGLEEMIFSELDRLDRPFFDIVFTGHSIGACISTLESARYADLHAELRISSQVFGCPRIGGEDLRAYVHALPNLRVFRVESSHDYTVQLPAGREWMSVGHCIQIGSNAEYKAYRFDKVVIPKAKSMLRTPLEISRGKAEHKIDSYVEKLSQVDKWPKDYSCTHGKGVVVDNEKREMA